MKKILILTSVAALSLPAFAASPAPTQKFISTEQIVTMCKNKGNAQDQGYCRVFMMVT